MSNYKLLIKFIIKKCYNICKCQNLISIKATIRTVVSGNPNLKIDLFLKSNQKYSNVKKIHNPNMESKRENVTKSMFNWSPVPKRNLSVSENKNEFDEKAENLYPNCDMSVWLRSCEKEILEPLEGVTIGQIPQWINGTLIRNGPGSIKMGDMEFNHLFDSSAFLHRFAIKNGNVTYQNRFLQSEVFKKNHAAKRIVVTEFGTCAVPDPCQSIFQRVASLFKPGDISDNAMISVYPFGDEIYAFTEYPIIHRINKLTLETENRLKIRKYITIINHTSHPHVLEDGSVYNLAMGVTKTGLCHNIVQFPKEDTNGAQNEGLQMFENAKIIATVRVRRFLHPSYMHTFGITKNYFILVEQPLSVSVPSIISSKITKEPMIGNLQWHSNKMTQFHVISKQTGQTAFKFYSETFFFLHIINQYEKSDHIVIDICCYRDPSMLNSMYIETMRSVQKNPDYAKMLRGRPMRFVLPLKIEKYENLITLQDTKAQAHFLPSGNIFVKPEMLCDLGCETPRINYEGYLGKDYRYFYAINSDIDSDNPGMLIKVDTLKKSSLTWCEKNCYPSEPIFIANPNSQFEDDGVILSAMIWGQDKTNQVGLLVLNAITFQEIGRTVFKTESAVPKCLHGWFLKHKSENF